MLSSEESLNNSYGAALCSAPYLLNTVTYTCAWRLQAIKSPNADTSQIDAAYDTLRDENKRRLYDQRHKGGASSSAPGASKREEGFEVVERGSGELQEWAQSSAQAGGDGKSEAISLGNVAGLLSEAVSGGRLCAPLVAAWCWLRPILQCGPCST